jgi:NADPH-dependent F420 reductase
MRVAIIGAGNMGGALARACVTAGHEVVLSARRAEHAAKVAADAGARAAGSNPEAVEGADMIMLAVPSTAAASVLDEIAPQVEGRIVVDLTNPSGDDEQEVFSAAGSAAEGVQFLAPEALVVKAFNTAFASRQADPVVEGVALDAFIAGDDDQAKQAVAELAGSIGFRPIDAGPLVMARALEAMALLNITLQLRNNWPWQAGFKLVGPTS